MSIINLYNGIFKVLANDAEIIAGLGVDVDDALAKAKHIQKRAKPQNLAENMPLIAFYTPDGKTEGGNDLVYDALFIFDIYTNDDVELAHTLAQRIIDLFDGVTQPFIGVENGEGQFIKGHESGSDLPNSYCFTILIGMTISLDK